MINEMMIFTSRIACIIDIACAMINIYDKNYWMFAIWIVVAAFMYCMEREAEIEQNDEMRNGI